MRMYNPKLSIDYKTAKFSFVKKIHLCCPTILSLFFQVIRYILRYFPAIILCSMLACVILLHEIYDEYLYPQMKLMQWNEYRIEREITYYNRICDGSDLSTDTVEDLIIGSDFTKDDCVRHIMFHGMSIYPKILHEETATELRDYIIKRNKVININESIDVIENNNRWSFGIGVNDDPIV